MWKELLLKLHPDSIFAEPASASEIEATEQALGVALPDDLKALLRETNGVSDPYGLGIVWSIERIKQDNLSFRTKPVFAEIYMPFDSLVFFADGGNGDYFAFPVIQGRVRAFDIFAWDHENDSRRWVAPSLEKYLEWWLQGKIKL